MPMVHIEPIDTFFFRDSRSFTAGEVNAAESNFPSPLTFFGAIGSLVLDNLKDEDKTRFFQQKCDHPILGKYTEELNLEETKIKLKGPFLHKGDNVYFPPPANLWTIGINPYSNILLPYESNWLWDLSRCTSNTKYIRPLKVPDSRSVKPLDQFVSIDTLIEYLTGNIDFSISSKSENSFYSREIRYGHTISKNTKTPKKSCLYSAPHLRFTDEIYYGNSKYEKSGFTLVVEGIDESNFTDKTISLGGERRKATVVFDNKELFDKQSYPYIKILNNIIDKKRFFIYFSTPAIFNAGWCIDLPPDFEGAKLVGAAVNKPLYISGWKSNSDNSGGEPRPLKKAVPAGSVYFFEVDSWDKEKIKEIYAKYNFGQSFSSIYQAAGFGIGLLGSW